MAKDFFTENNVEYTDKNAAQDLEAQKEMIEKSHQMGVPVIDIDGQIVIGFDKPRLMELLNISQ